MRGELSVRINDGVTDRMVSARTKGLRFRKVANGGHHSLSCTITVPRDTFSDLGPADKIWVYDTRTGKTVWEGYTENPGLTDGPAGQSFDLSAMGGMILAQDMSTSVVFIERSLDDSLWPRRDLSCKGASTQVVDNSIHLQFPSGQVVGPGSEVGHEYVGLLATGQRLLVLESTIIAGKTDSNFQQLGDSLTNGVYQNIAINASFSTSQGIASATVGTNFPAGVNGMMLISRYSGATTNLTDDNSWGRWIGPYLRPILANADGTDCMTGYLAYVVRSHEVVNHVLGKMLPQVNGAGAEVATGTTGITQLTYHDGAKPQEILDSLALFEPDYYWGIGATNAAGKHDFWYRAWPTTPRYEVSVKDGYNAPGGDVDLCNRIVVYWTDPQGVQKSTPVGQYVADLGNKNPVLNGALDPSFVGRVRDAASVTLQGGMSSAANAQRVGEMILASKKAPPKAATVTVRRPILDTLTGRYVNPWEIEPGWPVRVIETGDDLRLNEMEYTDQDCSATLTLGTPVLSTEQILALVGRPAI